MTAEQFVLDKTSNLAALSILSKPLAIGSFASAYNLLTKGGNLFVDSTIHPVNELPESLSNVSAGVSIVLGAILIGTTLYSDSKLVGKARSAIVNLFNTGLNITLGDLDTSTLS